VDRHIPADAAAQHTIRHYDPRHSDAAQAGRFAAPGLSAVMRGSHDHHVRVDPTPTPVSGISRDGGAARTKRGSSNPASRAPVGAPVQASFAEAAPVLPVAAAAEALWPRKQRAQDQQRRDPPLRSALVNGIEDKRRKSPTPGMHDERPFDAEMLCRYKRQEARPERRQGERANARH